MSYHTKRALRVVDHIFSYQIIRAPPTSIGRWDIMISKIKNFFTDLKNHQTRFQKMKFFLAYKKSSFPKIFLGKIFEIFAMFRIIYHSFNVCSA